MRETNVLDNLNYKTQAHARVCKESKIELELEENYDGYWDNKLCGKRSKFEGSYRKSGETYQDDTLKNGSP